MDPNLCVSQSVEEEEGVREREKQCNWMRMKNGIGSGIYMEATVTGTRHRGFGCIMGLGVHVAFALKSGPCSSLSFASTRLGPNRSRVFAPQCVFTKMTMILSFLESAQYPYYKILIQNSISISIIS